MDERGALLGVESFVTTERGYKLLVGWLSDFGPVGLVGVEGTGSYGAGLTRHLQAERVRVVEVDRPKRQRRRRKGKSDPQDAITAARAALSGDAAGEAKARDGNVESMRVLRVARASARKGRTQALNQMRNLVSTAPEPIRAELRGLNDFHLLERASAQPSDAEMCCRNPEDWQNFAGSQRAGPASGRPQRNFATQGTETGSIDGSASLQTHRVSWIHLDSYRLALHPAESYVYRMRSGRDLRLQAPEHRRHTDLDAIHVDMESTEPRIAHPATAVQDLDPSNTLSHVLLPTFAALAIQSRSKHPNRPTALFTRPWRQQQACRAPAGAGRDAEPRRSPPCVASHSSRVRLNASISPVLNSMSCTDFMPIHPMWDLSHVGRSITRSLVVLA